MKLVNAGNGVAYYTSELLGCPNAFSTRVGGASRLPHTSALNLAFGRGDEEETVLENLRLFGEAAGFDPETVVSARQIHSAEVRLVTVADVGKGYIIPADFEADGYVTADKGVTLGVKTADCVPVLLSARAERAAEPSGSEPSASLAAAIHSGWRGTAKQIVRNGVVLLEGLGIPAERIFAAIGPSIGQCCFEVGDDCRDEMLEGLGALADGLITRRGDKYYPDLAEINRRILLSCGVPAENIDVCRVCTHCHPELFYSHRRSPLRGTMLSVIRL